MIHSARLEWLEGKGCGVGARPHPRGHCGTILSGKRHRMDMKEFLSFRRMITPSIIQIIFWVGSALCVLGGLICMVAGATNQYGGGAHVLKGLLTLLLGPVVVRVYCEILIVVFRINDTLTDIRKNTEKPAPPTLP